MSTPSLVMMENPGSLLALEALGGVDSSRGRFVLEDLEETGVSILEEKDPRDSEEEEKEVGWR